MTTVTAPALHPTRVTGAWDESPTLRALSFAAAGGAAGHSAPGQYVKIIPEGGTEGYFALANAPGSGLELLVKRGAPAGDAIASLAPGDEVRITAPIGAGYPIASHQGKDLVLFAAGSGIAPIRAVVRHVLGDRDRWGRVRVYYGHRHPDEFAYRGEEPSWRSGDVDLVRVVSQPPAGWRGETGHVQDVFARAPGSLDNSVFYLCGMKGMVSGVVEALAGFGIDRERVYLNY
jgi:NAD(P)H-flavin reductase